MPIMNDPAIWLKELFLRTGLNDSFSSFFSTIALVLIVLLLSWLSNLIAKAVILKIVTRIVKKQLQNGMTYFLNKKYSAIYLIWHRYW
jgi:hypothetical protein